MAFMPFITAGDPDMAGTQRLIGQLAARQVDLIEVGFPYSDPIADGPVIQASYTRALEKHLTLSQIFDGLKGATASLKGQGPPLVAMASYSLMFRRGAEWFVDQAKAAGITGFIVPDLPGDEAGELFRLVKSRGLNLIQLVAPTTPRERVKNILRNCSGFVYCIAVAGTTGERERVADALLAQLRWLKEETDLPLAVGFGISRPEHVEPLRGLADGVIVGSAIVRRLESIAEGSQSFDEALRGIGEFAASMTAACCKAS
jgi:tryptophan synthase alpha chain